MPDELRGTPPNRVLVVDDEPHIRRLLVTRLTAEGYAVAEAENGEDGLEIVLAEPPDIVLLDLMMPGASGLEILSRIRSTQGLERLPVVILTAKGQDTDRELAMAGGASDFITKPFSPMKLLTRIQEILDAG